MRRLLCVGLCLAFAGSLVAQDNVPPEGFIALFNGKDTTGWKTYGGKADVWKVEKGMVYCEKGGGGWLITEKEYADFELHVEFRWSKEGGNSGVGLHIPPDGMGNVSFTGMEIQLIDDENWAKIHKFELKDYQHTGSIYGAAPATKQNNKPIGEWNKFKAVCKNRVVTIEVNGQKVLEAKLDDLKEKYAKSNPGILREKGSIGLQSYNFRVDFKNIYLKPL